MNNICVFCGSSAGNGERYAREARQLGYEIVNHNFSLVYGGGKVGLMGEVASAVIAAKGKAYGVIPRFLLDLEVGHEGLTELVVTQSMHERKQKMAELADAFIAMPGGFGTLEELAEIVTWVQLKLIEKPVALFNVNGYYDPLLKQLDVMMKEGFVRHENRQLIKAFSATAPMLEYINDHLSNKGTESLNLS